MAADTRLAPRREIYLGDGLYASFDGQVIGLRAPRDRGDDWVFMERDVYEALLLYARQVGWSDPK